MLPQSLKVVFCNRYLIRSNQSVIISFHNARPVSPHFIVLDITTVFSANFSISLNPYFS